MARRYRYIEAQGILLIIAVSLARVRPEENLALFKPATQSADNRPDELLASAAVDGCQQTDVLSGCCTLTKAGLKTAWWRVDLEQISTIDSIRIIYRADYQQRFAGYELYVSNTTTSPQDCVLCFEDMSSFAGSVQLNKIHQCPYVGRYVTVYNYRNTPKRHNWYHDDALLELCEVLVYGCPVGMYGNGDCNQTCPATCYGGNCYSKAASCFYGFPGTYGALCKNACSLNCKDRLCDNDTGYCLECIPGKFGDSCEQDCSVNCLNGLCTRDNGICYECITGKSGKLCDKDCACATWISSLGNITLSKTATQSTNRSSNEWLASAAVDGCQNIDILSGCCGHTQTGLKTAWWRVDLGQISTIDSIHIIYRDSYQLRLAGYELYVSNTTATPRDGILCYQDTSTTEAAVQLNITHQCPYVGRYVTVYNYRNTPKRYSWYSEGAVLELCEVLVYGCPAGKYGDGDCNQVCPATCYGGNCNPGTGSCFYCAVGTFGVFCENTCSLDCMNGLCDAGTGNCLECVLGKFGAICSQDCSIYCKDTGCAKDTGYCYGCVDGKYGDTCDVDCSVNCKDRLCDGNTGYCDDCIVGRYGVNCSNNCPAGCKDNVCYIDTGICNECISGKFGNTCNQDCSINCKDTLCAMDGGDCIDCVVGTYGSSCDQDCSTNCKDRLCAKITGYCTECVAGKLGNTCEQSCFVNCKDRLCVKDTGNCTECIDEKHGDSCDQNCPVNCLKGCTRDNAKCTSCKIGKYGEKCSMTCPVTCKDFVCDQRTGQCLECYPGKYGVVCGADCPSFCTSNMCEKNDGHCITIDSANIEQSSVQTYVIIIVILAVVCGLVVTALIAGIIYHCRYRRGKQNSSDKSADSSNTEQSSVKTYVVVIVILAVVCGLFAAALIAGIIHHCRYRRSKQNSSEKSAGVLNVDSNYTSIDHRQVEPTNVYEMMVT